MKYSSLVLLTSSFSIAFAWFGPVRIDHENRPKWGQGHPAIALGPSAWSNQPIYVAMKDDSMNNPKSCLKFQKSTDAGRTWLPADVLVRLGHTGGFLDITTDSDGNVYIVYDDTNWIFCTRSSDAGATWSDPVGVDHLEWDGGARIAVDTADNLVCVWGGGPVNDTRVFVSVSTDRGVTWSPRVRVDDDTCSVDGCYVWDVFVQPGTNHYLAAASHARPAGGGWTSSAYLYRSTDMGQTFEPGVRLDTFGGDGFAEGTHVVADANHIVCSYTDPTEARVLYTPSDTWGAPHFVGHSYRGPRLAISADGRVHAVLMDPTVTEDYYSISYTSSSDHGVTWSFPEFISGDTASTESEPDIAVDSAGYAYVVWQIGSGLSGHTLFSTNSPTPGVVEQPAQQSLGMRQLATVVRNVLFLPRSLDLSIAAGLLDISGRKVLDLKPGTNDVSRLAPGVYFVRAEPSSNQQPSALTKVVVAK
jgi:hypothetical protein